jgi:hypothetical protein
MEDKADKEKDNSYSQKRTFDLCLFSEDQIIIIEAKAQQPFKSDQLIIFNKDVTEIKEKLKTKVDLIALASSIYFENQKKHGKAGLLECFEGKHLSWSSLSSKYKDDPILARADKIYKQ